MTKISADLRDALRDLLALRTSQWRGRVETIQGPEYAGWIEAQDAPKRADALRDAVGDIGRNADLLMAEAGELLDAAEVIPAEPGPGPDPDPEPEPGGFPASPPFAADSPFNVGIPADPALAPDQAAKVAMLASFTRNAPVTLGAYGVPIYYADENTPRHDVRNLRGWWGYDVVRDVPIPDGAQGDQASDGHIVIVDTSTGCVFEGWQFAEQPGGGYGASSFGVLPGGLTGSGIFPNGASMNAAGCSMLGGLIHPHELEQGYIDHALMFSLPRQYVLEGQIAKPFTFTTGSGTGPEAIPMGGRIQLDPSYDVEQLPNPHARTIAVALQEYGAYLRDLGGTLGWYAVDRSTVPGQYEALGLPGGDYWQPGTPLDRMRVLDYELVQRTGTSVDPDDVKDCAVLD